MYLRTRRLKHIFFILTSTLVLYIFGVFHHAFETNFYTDFRYPYDGNIEEFVEKLRNNITPDVAPINSYILVYYKNCSKKCVSSDDLTLVYLIKSSPEHFDRRDVIRNTWGGESRFTFLEIRTVFLIGLQNSEQLQTLIDEESQIYSDIVQANFTDSYFNNTYKTMMGMQWAVKFCSNAKFYMFVDDDYYISTKNVIRFLTYPSSYPQSVTDPQNNMEIFLSDEREPHEFIGIETEENIRLFAGYVFKSSPHRHYTSKWYVSLKEYPYHMWPPYVTAGGYILSWESLVDMYYASFYTKHFRFDDIYLGILAYKIKIDPFHSDEFYFYKKPYDKFDFEYTIATHGYGNPQELLEIWTEQRGLGNA